ncbi:Glutamine transport system permease protein GlnP [compost metagenome]
MLRLSMPAITNELIMLVKASSLVSVVGLAEITRVSQTFAASTYRPMEFYLAAGAFYLITNLILSFCSSLLERKLARK